MLCYEKNSLRLSSLIPDEVDEDEPALDQLNSIKEQNAFNVNVQSPISITNQPTFDKDDLPRPEKWSGTMSHVQLNPAEEQKVIVEHIVKSEVAAEIPSTAVVKLRPFSRRIPQPNNESDYDTWHCNVKLILDEPSMSDLRDCP